MQHEGCQNWVAGWWAPTHGTQEKGCVSCNRSWNLCYLLHHWVRCSEFVGQWNQKRDQNSDKYFDQLLQTMGEFSPGIKIQPRESLNLSGYTKDFGKIVHSLCIICVWLLLILACCWDNLHLNLHLKHKEKNPSESLSK